MSSQVELWKFIKLVSISSIALGVPAFFYFFGYRLTGSLTVDFSLISYSNPFFYFNIGIVIFGLIAGMISQSVERNDYYFEKNIIISVSIRIIISVLLIAFMRWILF
ncbi:hypothetical protein [Gracilibacillus dipsosauri]|uniref:hypothetical protein n=1 Tax=Gracilibacillus dipsosauri TaxID=178340 RepID=UPI002409C39D